MATDFTYNNKTISLTGGIKPKNIDSPLDVRTRIETRSDMESIPNPFVGMHVIVKSDETNGNKATEYVVKTLKANALGIQNMIIDEVVTLNEFLGVENYEVVPEDELLTMYDDIKNK